MLTYFVCWWLLICSYYGGKMTGVRNAQTSSNMCYSLKSESGVCGDN
jgi:hypothetical protein